MQDSSDIVFRIRLNNIDHYQTEPTPLDPPFPPPKGSKSPPKIPIIRIFGCTETGQKVCAHIHGVFPYIYIEYPIEEIGLNPIDRDQWLRALRKSLDKALGSRGSDSDLSKPIRKPYVANISLVKGVPFYGFHVGWKYYAKIYLLDPRNMTRLSQILLSGAILQRVFQPYEAHIQYILQFMIDFNLYGCGFVDCRKIRFRQGFPDIDDVEEDHWHNESIPAHWILPEHKFPRQSHCSLEVDIHAQDIMNRKHISPRLLHHDFIERTKPTSPDLKLLHSLSELWKDENSRRGPTDQLNMEGFVASSGARGFCEPWGNEDERWDKVNAMIDSEKRNGDGRTPHFEGFLRSEELDYLVQTALDSVEDFFPSQEIGSETLHMDEDDDAGVDIDMGIIGRMSDDDSLGGNDDIELADIDKEMFEKNEEEEIIDQEVEEGRKGQKKELEPEQHQNEDEKEDQDSSNSSDTIEKEKRPEDAKGKRKESVDNVTSQSNEYGLSDFGQSILDGIQWPDGCDSDTRAFGDYNGSSSDNDPDPAPVFPQYRGMKVRKLEDGSIGIQDDHHIPLKRKDHPDTSDSGERASKVSKVKETRKAINTSPETRLISQIPINSALGKRKALERLDDTHVQSPSHPRYVSFDNLPNSSQWSPGTLEASMTRVITLPLSQEKPSQSSVINSQKTPVNTLDAIPSNNSSQTSSVTSDTEISATLEKETPKNIISQGQGENWHVHNLRPPRNFELAPIEDFGIPQVEYREPHYSDEKDIPENDLEYGGITRKFKANKHPSLLKLNATREQTREQTGIELLDKPSFRCWEIVARPPTRKEAIKWLEGQKKLEDPAFIRQEESGELGNFSQIEGPTQKNKHGFKFSQNKKQKTMNHESQPLSIMSLEVHVNTRGKLVPDPEQDPIVSIFWCLQSNDGPESNGIKDGYHVGILAVDEDDKEKTEWNLRHYCRAEVRVEYTELDIVNELIDIVRDLDPDILTGYEVHSSSWGYIVERARKVWGMDLCDDLSRVRQLGHGKFDHDTDPWGSNTATAIQITGRHMINIWRAMRGELNLLGYTMENVVFHLLHKRIPHYAHDTLTKWYQSGEPASLAIVLKYYLLRVQLDLEIIDQQELVSRTSEQARILGVDFNSVFSRGSQFKVESLMFRIAKPENFMLVSPSKRQVGGQNALECLPLVLEPNSNFYTSPVVVLDFQSLYPSIMIAYNHCYSTFIGRVDSWNGQDKMGFQVYKRTPRLLELCKDYINISPNGMMFMKSDIRKSLLAKMLAEILDTRVMVKNGMKRNKDDKQLQKLLNNRQLALKLIANVTYGYTSASFSGRMPCAEIADSIVQSGRETLEKAIVMINSDEKWGAEVVYGDTDSLFVHLKGKTKAQAFDIGEEIAARVTSMNPEPIKLKFEKVYHPCVLLAKKRYVGFKYEYRDQKEPEFDAKGIETVRRDGTPAVQKMVEKSLKILFRSSDLSQVKSYVTRQWTKIMKGDVSIQDFTIAKEVKLGNYAEGITPPPAVKLALERMAKDPRNEPQYGERYPFVVVASGPNTRLVDKSVEVELLLHNSDILSLDAEYYITKAIIPPLARIFNLVGADVALWYKKLPKVQRLRRIIKQKTGVEQKLVRKTMESFMTKSTTVCAVCNEKAETKNHICLDCMNERDRSVYKLQTRLSQAEKWNNDLQKICWSCSGLPWGAEIACDSQACPVYYSRVRQTSLLAYEREEIEPHLKALANVDEKDLLW